MCTDFQENRLNRVWHRNSIRFFECVYLSINCIKVCFSWPLVISILFVLRNPVTLFYITRSHSCSLSLIQLSLQTSHTLLDTFHIWPSPALNNPPSSHSSNSHSKISHSLEHSLTLSDNHLLHIWPSSALNNPPSSQSNSLSLQPLNTLLDTLLLPMFWPSPALITGSQSSALSPAHSHSLWI